MRNPVFVLAHAIAAFQEELAIADGPHYRGPGYPDERLAALIARVVAQLATEEREDPGNAYDLIETSALDDFIETLELAGNAVLDIMDGGSPPVANHPSNDEPISDQVDQQD